MMVDRAANESGSRLHGPQSANQGAQHGQSGSCDVREPRSRPRELQLLTGSSQLLDQELAAPGPGAELPDQELSSRSSMSCAPDHELELPDRELSSPRKLLGASAMLPAVTHLFRKATSPGAQLPTRELSSRPRSSAHDNRELNSWSGSCAPAPGAALPAA